MGRRRGKAVEKREFEGEKRAILVLMLSKKSEEHIGKRGHKSLK